MNRLSDDERSLLRTATREALSGRDWLAAARDSLDGAPRPDGWPIAMAAGWPGLLSSQAVGGAGLGGPEALLLMRELGRLLAGIPLFGHLVSSVLIASTVSPPTGSASPSGTPASPFPAAKPSPSGPASPGSASASEASSRASASGDLTSGARRAAWLPARPEAGGGTSVDAVSGAGRPSGPRVDDDGRLTGTVGWVPDAPGADLLIASAHDSGGRGWTVLIPAGAARIEEVAGYDASRGVGHVHLERTPATLVKEPEGAVENAWALGQALLGAESLGAAERLLEMSVEHARSRFAFGRAIGSFQAVKHQLVEVLRRVEIGRALADRAGVTLASGDADAYTVACALRFSAGEALDFASRTAIAVYGGMGATWEHPAALYFRRAQVARRLLAGHGSAAAEVGRRLLTAAF